MKDKIYKEPKTQQEKLRGHYGSILSSVGVCIIGGLIKNPESRFIYGMIFVWGIIVLLYALKVIGKEAKGV